MSILSANQNITPEWLQAHGWQRDGWGSLSWRREHNATVWCKIYEVRGTRGSWEFTRKVEVIWFPEDFEGYVTGYDDIQGKAFFNLTDTPKHNPVFKCADVQDLLTFITFILSELKKDPDKYR